MAGSLSEVTTMSKFRSLASFATMMPLPILKRAPVRYLQVVCPTGYYPALTHRGFRNPQA